MKLAQRLFVKFIVTPLVVTGGVIFIGPAKAESSPAIELLAEKIRLLENQNMKLQDEVDRLAYRLVEAEKRLDSVYGDIDSRLLELEDGQLSQNSSSPLSASPTAVTPDKSSNSPEASEVSLDDLYKTAKAAYDLSVYTEATKGFKKVVASGADDPLVWSAHFWLAQIALKENDRVAAREHFTLIVQDAAPDHNKVPQAKAWLDANP